MKHETSLGARECIGKVFSGPASNGAVRLGGASGWHLPRAFGGMALTTV